MSKRKHTLAAGLLILIAANVAYTQDDPATDEVVKAVKAEGTAAKPTKVEVVYRDGSKVRMTADETSIEVATKYGTLTIPLAEVSHIRLQPRLSDDAKRQIADAIGQMGEKSFADREAAAPKVRAMGVAAFPQLRQAAKSSNPEIRRRASEVLEEMEQRIPEEEQAVAEQDVVETVAFTLTGRVLTPNISAQSEFLGHVDVSLAQVESVRSLSAPWDSKFEIDAAQFSSAARWMETGLEIEARDRLLVTASGQIDLYPSDGEQGTYMSTPKGKDLEDLTGRRGKGSSLPGTLIGRIGELGKEFDIGERNSGIQHVSGQLYLRIAPSPLGASCSGAYTVKVAITRPEQLGTEAAEK